MAKSYWLKEAERIANQLKNPFRNYRAPRGFTSQGFEELGLGANPTRQFTGGPGEPPAGFVGGTTSASEWMVYWALTKILGPEGMGPRDYTWEYQQSMLGGRHMPGGAVVDFVVYTPMQNIGIRLQSFRFHLSASSLKQASDIEQRTALTSQDFMIVDIYEQDFIWDETGKAVLDVVNEAIAGRGRPNPLATGLVIDYA